MQYRLVFVLAPQWTVKLATELGQRHVRADTEEERCDTMWQKFANEMPIAPFVSRSGYVYHQKLHRLVALTPFRVLSCVFTPGGRPYPSSEQDTQPFTTNTYPPFRNVVLALHGRRKTPH